MNGRQHTRFYTVRPRRIPPEFCTDSRLEECSLLAAFLFDRVISQADDQGRLPGDPKHIKAVCVPLRDEAPVRKVAAAIDELVEAEFLTRYTAERRTFLQVNGWQDLQGKWGRRAYESRYPTPPGWTDDWVSTDSDPPADDALGPRQEDEMRALGAQAARDLRPPISSSSPSSLTVSSTGHVGARRGRRGMERVGILLEHATQGRMSDEEALALGMSLVARPGSGERVS